MPLEIVSLLVAAAVHDVDHPGKTNDFLTATSKETIELNESRTHVCTHTRIHTHAHTHTRMHAHASARAHTHRPMILHTHTYRMEYTQYILIYWYINQIRI